MTPKPRAIMIALATSILGTVVSACDPPQPSDFSIENLDPSEDVFLWIGADRDASVRCSGGHGCDDGANNFGVDGDLRVSNQTAQLHASYVHFHLPVLPPGAEIVEAYLELYHGATRGDGTSDDQCLPVAPAVAPWRYDEITWDNQPNHVGIGLGNPFVIALRSDAWSGTGNIAEYVQTMFDSPDAAHGFAIFAPQGPMIDKGFYSNNSPFRAVDDLGLAPRLLVRARMPDLSRDEDFVVPELPLHNDLPFDGENVLMARLAIGESWRPTWNVAVVEAGLPCAW
jgi:hypothetical protein